MRGWWLEIVGLALANFSAVRAETPAVQEGFQERRL
jgi:hypothetical protein